MSILQIITWRYAAEEYILKLDAALSRAIGDSYLAPITLNEGDIDSNREWLVLVSTSIK